MAATVDVSRLHPDDLLARLSVSEVRAAHSRLRAGADAKQSELRLMVGERYRDLLDASTSILALSDASRRVTATLTNVAESSASPYSITSTFTSNSKSTSLQSSNSPSSSELTALQSLSAHMKLLLDAPEQLWRLLEAHDYLRAAWLFLVSRVVHRNLSRDPPNKGETDDEDDTPWYQYDLVPREQFPLAQRQWDTLSPFRTQISHRATLDLRILTRTHRETASTLLSIVLLDSLSITSTASLLLAQRTKALRAVVAKLSSNQPTSISSVNTPRSDPRARSDRMARKAAVHSVTDNLTQVFDFVRGTVHCVHTLYGKDGRRGLMAEMLDAILRAPPSAPAKPSQGNRRKGHAARLSIISSFQVPQSTFQTDNGGEYEQLTTPALLSALPSSHLLMTFLPSSISSFVPYVDTVSPPSSPRASSQSQAPWIQVDNWKVTSLTSLISPEIQGWLGPLQTVRDVCAARHTLLQRLRTLPVASSAPHRSLQNITEEDEDENPEAKIRSLINETFAIRVRELWSQELNDLRDLTQSEVDKALAEIREGGLTESSSRHSEVLPAVIRATLSSLATSHPILQSSSLLKRTLRTIEISARHLRRDIDALMGDAEYDKLIFEYISDAEITLRAVSDHLAVRLSDMTRNMDNNNYMANASVEGCIFLGRIALALSNSDTTFAKDITRSATMPSKESTDHFNAVFKEALRQWSTFSAQVSVDAYRSTGNATSSSSGNIGSPAILNALLSLRDSLQQLGLHSTAKGVMRPPPLVLLGALLEALKEMHNKKDDSHNTDDENFLRTLCRTFDETTGSDDPEAMDLTASADLQLAGWQLMLGPLVGPKPRSSSSSVSALLPYGVPPTHNDFVPTVEIVKPGPRFAMLLVAPR